MAQRKQASFSELRVGILVLSAFAILILVIFAVSGDIKLPGFSRTTIVKTQMANVDGLRKGAEVRLSGKKVAILATHGFEQSELEVPRDRLKENGATVDIVSPEAGEIRGWELKDAEEAREQAVVAVRGTLERLTPVVTREIAVAAVPMAGDMASGVVDVGDDLIEGADDLVEALTEGVPGGGVVNQVWDVVLMPGRFGVRVATTVLRRPTGR